MSHQKSGTLQTTLSRRKFLKLAGASAAGFAMFGTADRAFANSAYLTHSESRSALQDSVVVKSAGWPMPEPMPTAEQLAADPTRQVYADILQAWLEQNPGVSIERVEFNIWDQQTLVTGLAGGTAPTGYFTTVLGNYNMPNTRAAFAQGLAADVTEYFNALGIESKVAPYVKAQMGKFIMNGRYYGLPIGYNSGVGFIYRKDLLAEAGIAEPTPIGRGLT
jgi:ABC-type glycerol-3-phosphate transport system substrate-binding protein